MKNLIKVTLLTAIAVIFGCGDDQADQAIQQEQAVPATVTPVIATETETTITMPADVSYTKPPWAVLEQNVTYFKTIILKQKMTGESSVNPSSPRPPWAVLEQNVYYYPD